MRYIITQGQLHQVVYKYLDSTFKNSKIKKIQNDYDSKAYRLELKSSDNEKFTYYFYGAGRYNDYDDTEHTEVATLHISPDIIDILRRMIKIRETKVIDIVSDWFSEKYQVNVDNIGIYPERNTPPTY